MSEEQEFTVWLDDGLDLEDRGVQERITAEVAHQLEGSSTTPTVIDLRGHDFGTEE